MADMTKLSPLLRSFGLLGLLALQSHAGETPRPDKEPPRQERAERESKPASESESEQRQKSSESSPADRREQKEGELIDGDYLPQETVDALDKVPVFNGDINDTIMPDGTPITDYLTPSDIVEPSLKRENELRSK